MLISTVCFSTKVENRTIQQLQSKLKKQARQAVSNMKRDMVETGNKNLKTSTIETLNNENSLLTLRKQIGPTATGFQSKHC